MPTFTETPTPTIVVTPRLRRIGSSSVPAIGAVGRICTAVLSLVLLAGLASCRGGETGTTRSRRPASGPPAISGAPARPTTAPCTPDPGLAAPPAAVPPDLALALQRFTTEPRVAGNRFGLSIWIDGLGEVGAYQPDLPLLPASNQKLLTAMGDRKS